MTDKYCGIDWNERRPFCVSSVADTIEYLNYEELWNKSKVMIFPTIRAIFPEYVFMSEDLHQECAVQCMDVFCNNKRLDRNVFYYLKTRYRWTIRESLRLNRFFMGRKHVATAPSVSIDETFEDGELKREIPVCDMYFGEELTESVELFTEQQRQIIDLLLQGYELSEVRRMFYKNKKMGLRKIADLKQKLSDFYGLRYEYPKSLNNELRNAHRRQKYAELKAS